MKNPVAPASIADCRICVAKSPGTRLTSAACGTNRLKIGACCRAGSGLGYLAEQRCSIAAIDRLAGEPSNNGTFLISRTGSTTSALTVQFTVIGDAVRSTTGTGGDYCLKKNGTSLLSGNTVTIDADQSSVQVSLVVYNDDVHEATETAMMMLQTGTGYDVGTPNSASISISDDDSGPGTQPSVTVSATDSTAGEPSDNGTFLISRTGSTASALTVYFTVGGDATQGSDYVLSDGTSTLTDHVTIAAGQSSVEVTLLVNNDSEEESTETASLTLDAETGYTVGTSDSATISIADDDAVVVSVSATDSTAGEPSDNGTF